MNLLEPEPNLIELVLAVLVHSSAKTYTCLKVRFEVLLERSKNRTEPNFGNPKECMKLWEILVIPDSHHDGGGGDRGSVKKKWPGNITGLRDVLQTFASCDGFVSHFRLSPQLTRVQERAAPPHQGFSQLDQRSR